MADSTDQRFFSRVALLALSALLVYLLWLILRPFVGAMLWASLLALILHPVNLEARERFRGRRGLAAILMTFAVLVAIVGPAVLVTLVFMRQAADLVTRLSHVAARYHVQKPQDIFRIPALDRAVRWLGDNTPLTVDQLRAWVQDNARVALELAVTGGRSLVIGALGGVLSLVLMLFLLYFLFRDGEEMGRRTVDLIPGPAERKRTLVEYLAQVTRAVVYGSLLTALVQGTLVGVGFLITGLPSPVVFGALAAVLSLLPVGGTAFVWLPGAIVLLSQGHWGKAVFLAAWGALLVGTVDNLLKPLFISGRAEISTLPVFLGVIGGLAAFGPIGMFAGPVLIALGLAIVRFLEEGESAKRETAVAKVESKA
jgi:predicted PurR-regulated permease PerM